MVKCGLTLLSDIDYGFNRMNAIDKIHMMVIKYETIWEVLAHHIHSSSVTRTVAHLSTSDPIHNSSINLRPEP